MSTKELLANLRALLSALNGDGQELLYDAVWDAIERIEAIAKHSNSASVRDYGGGE